MELKRLSVNDEPPEEAFFKLVHLKPAVAEFGRDRARVERGNLMRIVVERARVVVAQVSPREGERDGVTVEDDNTEAVTEEVVKHRREMVGGPAGFDDVGSGEFFLPIGEDRR